MLCKYFGVLHFWGELSVPSIIIFLQFYPSGISVDKAAVAVFVEFEHMRKGMPKAISKKAIICLECYSTSIHIECNDCIHVYTFCNI